MSQDIPTVRIVHPDVPCGMVIEAVDFDPALHKLYPVASPVEQVKDECESWTKEEIIAAALSDFGATLNPASKKADLLAAYRQLKG